jgi:hypothetical protein
MFLWGFVESTTESLLCPEQNPEGTGPRTHQTFVYTQKRNLNWLEISLILQ